MKKKINRYMMLLAAAAIGLTLIILSVVFYRIFETQVIDDLSVTCRLLSDIYDTSGSSDSIEQVGKDDADIRVTLVDSDGTVLYDSDADAASMENHLSRREVKEALEKGEGMAVRK